VVIMDSYTHMYDVLRILLQHSEPSTALLCSFAQVCQGWKTATQVLHRSASWSRASAVPLRSVVRVSHGCFQPPLYSR
jgi:hypothetical protein